MMTTLAYPCWFFAKDVWLFGIPVSDMTMVCLGNQKWLNDPSTKIFPPLILLQWHTMHLLELEHLQWSLWHAHCLDLKHILDHMCFGAIFRPKTQHGHFDLTNCQKPEVLSTKSLIGSWSKLIHFPGAFVNLKGGYGHLFVFGANLWSNNTKWPF